jgi:hypothetical protein
LSENEYRVKLLADGREISVFPILGGRARVAVGIAGSPFVDDLW